MKKFKKLLFSVSVAISIFLLNILTFATSSGTADVDAPTLSEVRSIVGDGLDLFF